MTVDRQRIGNTPSCLSPKPWRIKGLRASWWFMGGTACTLAGAAGRAAAGGWAGRLHRSRSAPRWPGRRRPARGEWAPLPVLEILHPHAPPALQHIQQQRHIQPSQPSQPQQPHQQQQQHQQQRGNRSEVARFTRDRQQLSQLQQLGPAHIKGWPSPAAAHASAARHDHRTPAADQPTERQGTAPPATVVAEHRRDVRAAGALSSCV